MGPPQIVGRFSYNFGLTQRHRKTGAIDFDDFCWLNL